MTVELSPAAQQVVNVVLIWLGFGVLTGLLARALLPGREPRGLTGTLILGVMGSFLGPAAMSAIEGPAFAGSSSVPVTERNPASLWISRS